MCRGKNKIRPFAVHRKNWLFSDTTAGAEANAVYYSFIETAKLNKLNIYKYINYLLGKREAWFTTRKCRRNELQRRKHRSHTRRNERSYK